MVASKTSFVIAAVALGAATSVYAAPVQYNGGADLAARGFEDEDFQLAARFFDDEFSEFDARDFYDELEARDFDEEEYLFARDHKSSSSSAAADDDDDYPPPPPHSPHSGTKLSGKEGSFNQHPKDRLASSSPTHSTSTSGSLAGLNGHRVLAANSGTGVPASKDGEHKHHHKHHHHKHHHKYHQYKNGQSNLASPSRFATSDHKSTDLTGSESTHHPAAGFNSKVSSGSKDHSASQKMTIFAADRDGEDDDVETPVKHAKSPAQQKSLKQRNFEEEDAILLARSLGLDDDYFLEARSFDDDMYEYY